jgi:hypothetical protein
MGNKLYLRNKEKLFEGEKWYMDVVTLLVVYTALRHTIFL